MITWLLLRRIADGDWLVARDFFVVSLIIELMLFIGLGAYLRIKRQMAWPKTIGLLIAGDILVFAFFIALGFLLWRG